MRLDIVNVPPDFVATSNETAEIVPSVPVGDRCCTKMQRVPADALWRLEDSTLYQA
jgi:hypothetical protein